MQCSNRNLLQNGNFRLGSHPWKGRNIHLTANPLVEHDYSMAMGNLNSETPSLLFQTVSGPFESQCAYYLYFRVLNRSPEHIQPRLFAVVSYLSRDGRIQRTTPLRVLPPHVKPQRFSSYFTIVPPPSTTTRSLVVVFYVDRGTVFVDYIRVASHRV
ncbi:hypothetical protein [Novibacillus thermophilus]|jgi:hypothetical protein|uniref:Uncharacterized protein n=1 Tax=Novibacillus thermophilus TaxID=1471761 RepID=A0A1U9K8I7_9BACL|nr:hypothetical protein [Novibacillus thermophilus]AQS56379.1 hypothetical protein B0W44_12015 [Novibacillus thermophilus]